MAGTRTKGAAAARDVLRDTVGFNMHRGVLALGRREQATETVFLDTLPEQALVLVGCGISNHDNIGSIFRNAAAFGADAVLLDQGCCDPLYRKALRVSVSTLKRWLEENPALAGFRTNASGWRLFSPEEIEQIREHQRRRKREGKTFKPDTLRPVNDE